MAFIPLVAQIVDISGNVVAGVKANFYIATTTTPQATYTESTGTTAAANPVVGDANGIFVTWLDDTKLYKIVVTDSSGGVTYFSSDNIDPSKSPGIFVIHTGVSDQSLLTTSDVTFANITTPGTMTALSAVIAGVTISPAGAVVGQALGFPNNATTLEPYTPAGGGDVLAANNGVEFTDKTKFASTLNVTITVETFTDARALDTTSMTDGDAVSILGGDAIGDGAGGLFRYDAASTATDDDGIVLDPTTAGAGRLRRVYQPGTVHAKWFRAKFDNSTDDRAAIQAALDACATDGGGQVICPPGTALVSITPSMTYALNLPANVRIEGAGLDVTYIKLANAQNAHVIYSVGDKIGVVGLTVDGNKANQTSGDDSRGIYTVDSNDVFISRVRIINASDHGALISTGGGPATDSQRIWIEHSIAENNGSDGNPGGTGFATNGETVTLLSNISRNNVLAGFKNTGNYVTALGNEATGNGAGGMVGGSLANSGIDHSYIGNKSNNNNSDGYRFSGQVDKLKFIGNTGDGNDECGFVSLNSSTDLQIIGNSFRNNGQSFTASTTSQGSGIALLSTSGTPNKTIISGNVCTDDQGTKTQEYGLYLASNAANVKVAGDNDFSDNKNGAIYNDSGQNSVKFLAGIEGLSTEYNTNSGTTVTGVTTETDMISQTIIGKEMSRQGILKIKIFGNVSGTNGNKTIRLYIGSSAFTVSIQSAADTKDWVVEILITLTNYTSSRAVITGTEAIDAAGVYVSAATISNDWNTDTVIKITGQLANGSDTISPRGMLIERVR